MNEYHNMNASLLLGGHFSFLLEIFAIRNYTDGNVLEYFLVYICKNFHRVHAKEGKCWVVEYLNALLYYIKIKWFPKWPHQFTLQPACMRILSALCLHQHSETFFPHSGGCIMISYCPFNLHFHQDMLSSHVDSRSQDENTKRIVRNILSNWVNFTS